MVTDSAAWWCVFYGSGIIGTLLVAGVAQEHIMTLPYGEEEEFFEPSVFLVFLNRAATSLFAFVMVAKNGESFMSKAPLWKYFAISFSNVGAGICQYEALKFVSFPVQTLGKSFKMMPVMLWGMAVSGKRYNAFDWTVAFLVTGGISEVLLTGPIAAPQRSAVGNATYGVLLLLGYLVLDGFTSPMQEKLFREHATSKYNQMLYTSLWSMVISFANIVISGDLESAVGFIVAHPLFKWDALILSTSSVASQWFIYSQIKEFGALVFAATMNVRQVASILVSYAKFGHMITPLQILGLLIVFGALFCKSYVSMTEPTEETQKLLEKIEPTSREADAAAGL